jgi:broad specificity phosphatase PhoE
MFIHLLCSIDAAEPKPNAGFILEDADLVAEYRHFFTHCFCSPLQRAQQTLAAAKHAYIREPVQILPALREVRGGAVSDHFEHEELGRREFEMEVKARVAMVMNTLHELKKTEPVDKPLFVLLVSHPDFLWYLTGQDGKVGHLLTPGEAMLWIEL